MLLESCRLRCLLRWARIRPMIRTALWLLLLLLSIATSVRSGNVVSNTDPITHRQFYSSGSYSAAWDLALIDGLPLCRGDMVPPLWHVALLITQLLTLATGRVHVQQMQRRRRPLPRALLHDPVPPRVSAPPQRAQPALFRQLRRGQLPSAGRLRMQVRT